MTVENHPLEAGRSPAATVTAQKQLESIEAACGRADAVILALTAIALYVLYTSWDKAADESMIARAGFAFVAGTLAFTFVALFRGAFPRISPRERSLFDPLAVSQRTWQQFRGEYLAASDDGMLHQMLVRIHDRAHALAIKQEETRRAFIAILIAISLSVVMLVGPQFL